MSDRHRQRVRPEHEGLVRLIRSIAAEEVDLAAPRTGTVVGDEGGKVRVRLDDEDSERSVGFAKSPGHRYPKGTRVRVERLRQGGRARGSYEEVVTGIISEGGGVKDQVIGDEDIIDRSIQGHSLANGAVGTEQIGGQQIEGRHLKPNAIGNNQLDGDAVQTRNIKAGSITQALLDQQLDKKISDAATTDQLGNLENRVMGKIPTDYLKPSDLNGVATEDWVKRNAATTTDLKTLERKLKEYVDSKTKSKDKP